MSDYKKWRSQAITLLNLDLVKQLLYKILGMKKPDRFLYPVITMKN